MVLSALCVMTELQGARVSLKNHHLSAFSTRTTSARIWSIPVKAVPGDTPTALAYVGFDEITRLVGGVFGVISPTFYRWSLVECAMADPCAPGMARDRASRSRSRMSDPTREHPSHSGMSVSPAEPPPLPVACRANGKRPVVNANQASASEGARSSRMVA